MGGIYWTKFLKFRCVAATDKTETYDVLLRSQGSVLATIKWYGQWRQYCFFPHENTVWNVNCLHDINAFIQRLMGERRMKKKGDQE